MVQRIVVKRMESDASGCEVLGMVVFKLHPHLIYLSQIIFDAVQICSV